MAKWETPKQQQGKLASRQERSEMTRVQIGMRTCQYCKGVFRAANDSIDCERWHRDIFQRMRRDLVAAIDRLSQRIASGERSDKEATKELKRLGNKLRDVPKD